METYKKGDYLAIRTNQPVIGFIERFGHGLSTDNVEPEDYIARVKEVIDSENYFVYIPSVGYRCIMGLSEIVGKVSESELAAEDKEEEKSIFPFLSAPTYMYENEEDVPGNSIADKCEYLARKAMSALFPQNIIVSINVAESEFMKEICFQAPTGTLKKSISMTSNSSNPSKRNGTISPKCFSTSASKSIIR